MSKFCVVAAILITNFCFAENDSSKLNIRLKTYCKPRIVGMSPNKIISIGYDYEFNQTLKTTNLGNYDKKQDVNYANSKSYKKVDGLRFAAKIPIINKPKLIWQIGLNYWHSNYQHLKNYNTGINTYKPNFGDSLATNDLTSAGLNTSIYKPLNEMCFVIFQTTADLNGDYKLKSMQSLNHLRYSAIVLYGKRPSDFKQWAIGFGRTYGAGQSSILPLLMFNYTAANKKWGTEILLPARAWYRRKLNENNFIRAGYELEGASYHLGFISNTGHNYQLRRGELRTKIEYQCKLYKTIWLSAQTGYCKILNYKLDDLKTGKDFTRNISGNHNYVMMNKLSDFLFFNLSINFVSF